MAEPEPDALLALERGGVLAELSTGATVWAVGAGSGDLAHLQRLRPEGTYVIGAAGIAPDLRPPRLELLILGSASGAEVAGCLATAHELGCPYVYTREPAAAELARRWYWCHEIPVAPARRLRLSEVRAQARGPAPAGQSRYRHTVGWRRLLPGGQPAPGIAPGAPV
jgi:hypothetical protein